MERKDRSRLAAAFTADLTVMIRLIGKWMVELCCVDNPSGADVALDATSTRSGQSTSYSGDTATLGGGQMQGQAGHGSGRRRPTKLAETLGTELAESTAVFLEQLLLLVDRGFVLQRLRDLLAMLEIRHNMVSIDCLLSTAAGIAKVITLCSCSPQQR